MSSRRKENNAVIEKARCYKENNAVIEKAHRKERLTEQFLSMHIFNDSIILFTKQCSSPSEHFAFNALFL